jgi:hypothetical protein
MYVTGYFQGEFAFEDKKVRPNGDSDIYLAKYNKQGKLIWLTTLGSDYNKPNVISETGTSVITDHKGNVFLSGDFRRTMSLGKRSLTSSGKDDIFLAKYSRKGELIWVKSAGGKSQDHVSSSAVDNDGNVYVTGYYQNEAHFGNTTRYSSAFKNFFIAKYDPAGELIWVKDFLQQGQAEGKSIVYFNDKIYVGGNFQNELAGDGSKIISRATQDMFIARFSLIGNCELLIHSNEANDVELNKLDVGSGGIFCTGWKSDGSINSVSRSIFVSRFASNGDLVWTRKIKGSGNSEGRSLQVVQDDQVFLAASYQKELTIDQTVLVGGNYQNAAFLHINDNGEVRFLDNALATTGWFVNDISFHGESIVAVGNTFSDEERLPNEKKEGRRSDILMHAFKVDLKQKNNLSADDNVLSVYPNPSNGIYNITFLPAEEISGIQVIDLTGKVVYEQTVDAGSTRVSVSMVAAAKGVYNVRLVRGELVFNRRIVLF